MTKPATRDSFVSKQTTSAKPSDAKLPHERDESGDSIGEKPRAVIEQAKADIDSGKQATDRGEATDAAYQKQKEPK